LERVIGHIDLDYFYAQVEEVENPSLKEWPVIVCVFSGRTEESGVVSTANYRARELGVHSGMPIVLAKKKLEGKNAAVIKMEHEKYEVVSSRIMDDLTQRVDILEPTGIDEAFFDLTSSTGGDYAKAQKTAQTIKESILNNEHLICSVGLGRSKVVAKLGSDIAKPGGLKVVTPETTIAFLDPLPVTKLYGVGPKTASTFEEMGIKTIGDLARTNPPVLDQIFGRKFGAYLLSAAKGEDDDPVRAGLEPTQFSRIVTLKRDTRDPREAFEQLAAGIEYVHGKLISSGKSFKTVTAIGILTDLSTKTKSKTFEIPVNDAAVLRDSTLSLFEELSVAVRKDFRRVGLRVSGFTSVEDQTSLSEFVRR
jgi:DNA polymerase IV (archaeal DinB-like DNA polymerase)